MNKGGSNSGVGGKVPFKGGVSKPFVNAKVAKVDGNSSVQVNKGVVASGSVSVGQSTSGGMSGVRGAKVGVVGGASGNASSVKTVGSVAVGASKVVSSGGVPSKAGSSSGRDARKRDALMSLVAMAKGKKDASKSEEVSHVGKTFYLSGCPLDGDRPVMYELSRAYGIGREVSRELCAQTGVHPLSKVGTVFRRLNKMNRILEERKLRIGSELRREVTKNVTLHMTLGTNRGVRMRSGLPTRGQCTSTHARTAKRLTGHRGGLK